MKQFRNRYIVKKSSTQILPVKIETSFQLRDTSMKFSSMASIIYIYVLIICFKGTGSFHEKKYLHPINLDQSTNGRVLQLHMNLYIYYINTRLKRAKYLTNYFPLFFLSSLDQHILTSTSQAICNSAYNANVKCSVMNHDEKHFSVSHEKRIYSYKCLVSKNISALKVAFKAIFALPLTEYTHRLIKLSA